MQDAFMAVGGIAVIAYVCAQGFFLLLPLARSTFKSYRAGGYREPPPDLHRILGRENEDLQQRIRTLEKESVNKDRVIEELWYKVHGAEHPDAEKRESRRRQIRLVGAVSMATAFGMVIGAVSMVPVRTGSESRALARPTMQAQTTWDGEVLVSPREAWTWAWQCRDRHPTLVAIGSTIVRQGCHPSLPSLYLPSDPRDGDRAAILWFYPERTGPAALSYVLN